MKKLVLRIFIYSLIFISLFVLTGFFSGMLVRSKSKFKLDETCTGIIVGNSHVACGLDDKFLHGYKNLGAINESYLYSYIKIREVLDANSQVKTVFLAFDNIQVSEGWTEKWLWDGGRMVNLLVAYQPYMTNQEIARFIYHNPKSTMKCQQLLLKRSIEIARTPSFNYLTSGYMGGNLPKYGSHTDSLLRVTPEVIPAPAEAQPVHELNFEYLQKIIEFCEERQVKLILIRTPVLKQFSGWITENSLQKVLRERLHGVSFIDTQKFPLTKEDYFDLDHLNTVGSEKLSKFLEDAINHGLLDQEDMKSYVNMRIDSLN